MTCADATVRYTPWENRSRTHRNESGRSFLKLIAAATPTDGPWPCDRCKFHQVGTDRTSGGIGQHAEAEQDQRISGRESGCHAALWQYGSDPASGDPWKPYRRIRVMRLVVSAQESIPESWRSRFELVTADELPPGEDFHLRFTDDALRLCRGRDARGICVRADDIHRRLKGDFLLGRACVAGAGGRVHVLDAMAGLGIDGVALALRGHRVTLVERNVVLWALLDDLLRRLDLADVDLHCADSRELFLTPTVSDRVFDVVYLDPMFPARSKGALPGKNMQYVSALLDATEETESTATNPAITRLVELAQSSAASHVVLKRRRKEPVLLTPDWQIKGRSVRYDVFRSRAG